jgi:hypothetical protein
MLSICMCARFPVNPKECNLRVMKRILRYLVHTPNFGLWYPKGSNFYLIVYSDINCWGPSASEGPQKHDLTMFSK